MHTLIVLAVLLIQASTQFNAQLSELRIAFGKELTGTVAVSDNGVQRIVERAIKADGGQVAVVSGIISASASTARNTETTTAGVRITSKTITSGPISIAAQELVLRGDTWSADLIAVGILGSGDCRLFHFVEGAADSNRHMSQSGGSIAVSRSQQGKPATVTFEGPVGFCFAFAVPKDARKQKLKLSVAGQEFAVK